jgi:hypothetical protein
MLYSLRDHKLRACESVSGEHWQLMGALEALNRVAVRANHRFSLQHRSDILT